MPFFRTAVWVALAGLTAAAPPAADAPAAPPGAEVLSYTTEWRFIRAGNARLSFAPDGDGFAARLHLESAGMVSGLYRIEDDYASSLDRQLCVVSLSFTAHEGSRRRETSVTYDGARRKASYQERDLVDHVTATHETDIPPCVHDVVGALYVLRRMRVEPGRTIEIPISDGKKTVMARIEAQERETLKLDSGTYRTIRYEAFLFNGVMYRRRGRLFVWLTDDERRLPVQVRVRMPLYIGTVTLQLLKPGKT
jgi:hypothetical protein